MKLEEVEKLSRKELRARADECFAQAERQGFERAPLYFQAQFYARGLEHRYESWVSFRDLLLEIVVIALIGWEIHMGYHQQWQQDQAFQQEQAIWKNMETTSSATATTMVSENGTMETMSRTLGKELGLFYDVSLNLTYNADKKRLTFVNMGRTNLVLWGLKLGGARASIDSEGRTVQPNGGYDIDFADGYAIALAAFPEGKTGLLPFDVYVKNERGEEFTEHCFMGVAWDAGTLKLSPQVGAVVPEHWSNIIAVKEGVVTKP